MTARVSRLRLLGVAGARLAAGLIGLAVLLFLPAGTFAYWQAWVWLSLLGLPTCLLAAWLLIKDPALLERRTRSREPQREQSLIIRLSLPVLVLVFGLPGLDHRLGWSAVPTAVVAGADAVLLLSYGLFVLVVHENSYASRVVEVEAGQKVVSTGPYAIVRHPMYLAMLMVYAVTPLALGSYWALIPALLIVPVLVARIWNEEAALHVQLQGYADYMQRVRYRLIPGIW